MRNATTKISGYIQRFPRVRRQAEMWGTISASFHEARAAMLVCGRYVTQPGALVSTFAAQVQLTP